MSEFVSFFSKALWTAAYQKKNKKWGSSNSFLRIRRLNSKKPKFEKKTKNFVPN